MYYFEDGLLKLHHNFEIIELFKHNMMDCADFGIFDGEWLNAFTSYDYMYFLHPINNKQKQKLENRLLKYLSNTNQCNFY